MSDIQRTYTYDAQNQLLSETIDGDTTSYNLRYRRQHPPVTGPGVTKTFTYDDTGDWKDLLTSVTINGETGQLPTKATAAARSATRRITLTATTTSSPEKRPPAGEPDRQAAAFGTATAPTASRTSKALMNGDNPPIMHYYTTQNGKIVREQWGSAQMDFVYDATGEPLALYYRVKLPNSNEYPATPTTTKPTKAVTSMWGGVALGG